MRRPRPRVTAKAATPSDRREARRLVHMAAVLVSRRRREACQGASASATTPHPAGTPPEEMTKRISVPAPLRTMWGAAVSRGKSPSKVSPYRALAGVPSVRTRRSSSTTRNDSIGSQARTCSMFSLSRSTSSW